MCWCRGPSRSRVGLHGMGAPQSHRSPIAHTLLKSIGTCLRGVRTETQAWGAVGVFAMILHVTWVQPPTSWSCFQSPHAPGGASVFVFLFALEGVLSRGPASRSRKRRVQDVPLGPVVFWSQSVKVTSPECFQGCVFHLPQKPHNWTLRALTGEGLSLLCQLQTGAPYRTRPTVQRGSAARQNPYPGGGPDGLSVGPRSMALHWTTSLWMSVNLCCGAARTPWPSPSWR